MEFDKSPLLMYVVAKDALVNALEVLYWKARNSGGSYYGSLPLKTVWAVIQLIRASDISLAPTHGSACIVYEENLPVLLQ